MAARSLATSSVQHGCPHAAAPGDSILQALTDKLKGMASEVGMATTRHGDLHLKVHTSGELQAAAERVGQQGCRVCPAALSKVLAERM